MPADLVHLVRHGEVHNPDRILYGRIPGFRLSERGRRMARRAAEALAGHDISGLVASPLERTRESAAPWSELYGLPIRIDDRVIEPTNDFEGTSVRAALLRNPLLLWRLRDPARPSWGESFASMRDRMLPAMAAAADSVDHGEVVIVSHQSPIEVAARSIAGKPLPNNPARRRTTLSSITTFRRDPGTGRWSEVGFQEPAADLLTEAVDRGAV